MGRGRQYPSRGRLQYWHAPGASFRRPGGRNCRFWEAEKSRTGQPQFLPGGKFALFAVYQQAVSADTTNLEAISLSDGKLQAVVKWGGTKSPLSSQRASR